MLICKGKDRLDAFKGCGKQVNKYGNATYYLCIPCNNKRLKEKTVPKKATGQANLFFEIWNEREHKSFLSGIPLDKFEGSNLFFNLFAHVLSKALNKYPKFILNKENIILLTPEEHTLLDHGTKEQRDKYALEKNCDWDKIYKLEIILKLKYKKL